MISGKGLAGLALLLTLLACWSLAPVAVADDTVKHVGALTDKRVDDEGGCQRTTFFEWSELPGATSYTVLIEDTLGFYGFPITYPPYDAESEGEFGGVPPVAKGRHRQALTYQGGGVGGCQANDLERFTVKSFTATFDDKSRIVGTVTDKDGLPIPNGKVSIRGPSGSTEKTNRGGTYGAVVKKGRYTVEVEKGYCLRGGGKGCKRSTTLEVKGAKSVNFVRGDETVKLSGVVVRRVCDFNQFNECELDYVPAENARVAATGSEGEIEAVTDAAGRFKLEVPIGQTSVRLTGYPADDIEAEVVPGAYNFNASRDRRDIDFEICDRPADYTGPEPGCNLVKVEGEVVDVEGRPYANATVTGPGDSAVTGKGGQFKMFVPRGRVRLVAKGELVAESNPISVSATKRVNSARLKIFPEIFLQQSTTSNITAFVDGLTSGSKNDEFRFSIERRRADATGCRFRQNVFFDLNGGSRFETLDITPNEGFSSFCPGKWAAVVYTPGGKELQTRLFEIL